MDDGVHVWRSPDRFQATFDASDKILPQAELTLLVPAVGVVDVLLHLRGEDESSGHGEPARGV